MNAVKGQHKDMVVFLLNNGADPNTRDNVRGWEDVSATLRKLWNWVKSAGMIVVFGVVYYESYYNLMVRLFVRWNQSVAVHIG